MTVRAVLLGPPGAGKGTQASRLAPLLQATHLATGDLLRHNVQAKTELGERAASYMEAGELVPDEVVVAMVAERLESREGFILDGFPRTLHQARMLEELLARLNRSLRVVVFLNIDEDEAVRRISGRRVCANCGRNYHAVTDPPGQPGVCDTCGGRVHQRDDDRAEVVERRLEVYHDQTEPLLRFYRERGLLRDVDATRPVEQVTNRVLATVREATSDAYPSATSSRSIEPGQPQQSNAGSR